MTLFGMKYRLSAAPCNEPNYRLQKCRVSPTSPTLDMVLPRNERRGGCPTYDWSVQRSDTSGKESGSKVSFLRELDLGQPTMIAEDRP
jgi:hypothetical protein